jgi:hypothetical protein
VKQTGTATVHLVDGTRVEVVRGGSTDHPVMPMLQQMFLEWQRAGGFLHGLKTEICPTSNASTVSFFPYTAIVKIAVRVEEETKPSLEEQPVE